MRCGVRGERTRSFSGDCKVATSLQLHTGDRRRSKKRGAGGMKAGAVLRTPLAISLNFWQRFDLWLRRADNSEQKCLKLCYTPT